MQLPLRFPSEDDAVELIDGVPVSEQALSLEIGACSRCGDDAAEKGSGLLANMRIERGVMVGDVICIDCALADPDLEFDESMLE